MGDNPNNVLDYQKPQAKRFSRQRILYCTGLPILAFGVGIGLSRENDLVLTAVTMAIGALLIAFALPTQDRP